MKNIIYLAILSICLSCNSASILDKEFQYQFYENLDYEKLLRADDVSEADLFLINYTILRQRDYFNYEIEGKTYREILEMAQLYQQSGLPVDFKFNENGDPTELVQTISVDGVGFARKGSNSKRIVKTFSFRTSLKNPTAEDIVVLNSSYFIKGPFQDHLSTVNYEINCIVPANSQVDVDCVVPGKIIQKNILFEGDPNLRRIGIDALLAQLEVVPSGISVQNSGKYFKDCFFNAASIEPHKSMLYSKYAEDHADWKKQDANGTYTIHLGDAHTPDDSDEVIQMR